MIQDFTFIPAVSSQHSRTSYAEIVIPENDTGHVFYAGWIDLEHVRTSLRLNPLRTATIFVEDEDNGSAIREFLRGMELSHRVEVGVGKLENLTQVPANYAQTVIVPVEVLIRPELDSLIAGEIFRILKPAGRVCVPNSAAPEADSIPLLFMAHGFSVSGEQGQLCITRPA